MACAIGHGGHVARSADCRDAERIGAISYAGASNLNVAEGDVRHVGAGSATKIDRVGLRRPVFARVVQFDSVARLQTSTALAVDSPIAAAVELPNEAASSAEN